MTKHKAGGAKRGTSNRSPVIKLFRSPVFKLLRVSGLLARPFIDKVGSEHDLTLTEWRVMVTLDGLGGMSNIEIANELGLEEMNVSRALDRLNSNGRVHRTRDTEDGRRLLNQLTPEGKSVYRSVAKLARRRQQAMFKGLTATEVAVFEQTLERIIDHLVTVTD